MPRGMAGSTGSDNILDALKSLALVFHVMCFSCVGIAGHALP